MGCGGAQADDEPVEKLDKLDVVLGELGLPVPEHGPVLASLLSVPADGRYPALEVAPQELRRKTFESLLAIFEAMATRAPVLTVVEDAHWMDPSTEELLGLLIERLLPALDFPLREWPLEWLRRDRVALFD